MPAGVLLVILSVLLVALPAKAVTVEPNPMLINATFHGGTLKVRGVTEPGSQVFVMVTGARIAERFNRKGRVGPVWANVGALQISGVPRLCLIASSTPDTSGIDPRVVDDNLLDLEAVGRRATIDGVGSDRVFWLREYIRLKQSQRVFGSFANGVRLTQTGAQPTFEATIPWPDGAAAGEYEVAVVHLQGSAVVRTEKTALRAELVGLPAWISHLAFQRSKVYGVLSVVVAVAVGFLMGLVFKKGGGH
jgi:hypothetical protein